MADVLIPLNSGLVFTSSEAHAESLRQGLNPFEFRAGIYLVYALHKGEDISLNPFEFRAGIYLLIRAKCRASTAS